MVQTQQKFILFFQRKSKTGVLDPQRTFLQMEIQELRLLPYCNYTIFTICFLKSPSNFTNYPYHHLQTTGEGLLMEVLWHGPGEWYTLLLLTFHLLELSVHTQLLTGLKNVILVLRKKQNKVWGTASLFCHTILSHDSVTPLSSVQPL